MYVYAGDVAKAIHLMITKGVNGAKYNISGQDISNEEMAHTVALILEKNLISQKTYPYKERPGWDFSYRIKGTNLRALGWEPTDKFVDVLRQTVRA
jgi:dTDP-D-glucose 4,6-dehydratase